MRRRLFIFLSIISLCNSSCRKEAEIPPNAYRLRFTGDFHFKITSIYWTHGKGDSYDTSFFDGLSELSERPIQVRWPTPKNMDFDSAITIKFQENGTYSAVTTVVSPSGVLSIINAGHYYLQGAFSDKDHLEFSLSGLGGLGSGSEIYVSGQRR